MSCPDRNRQTQYWPTCPIHHDTNLIFDDSMNRQLNEDHYIDRLSHPMLSVLSEPYQKMDELCDYLKKTNKQIYSTNIIFDFQISLTVDKMNYLVTNIVSNHLDVVHHPIDDEHFEIRSADMLVQHHNDHS